MNKILIEIAVSILWYTRKSSKMKNMSQAKLCKLYWLPMQSKIQPTVPSPPHASTLNSGTSRKKFNLKIVNEDIYLIIINASCIMQTFHGISHFI